GDGLAMDGRRGEARLLQSQAFDGLSEADGEVPAVGDADASLRRRAERPSAGSTEPLRSRRRKERGGREPQATGQRTVRPLRAAQRGHAPATCDLSRRHKQLRYLRRSRKNLWLMWGIWWEAKDARGRAAGLCAPNS